MPNYIQNVGFSTPESAEQQSIDRRRKLAEALQAQSMQPLEGQTAPGGWAVPIHPLQGMSKLAQALVAGQGMKRADEQSSALAGQQQQRSSADMSLLAQALQGRRAQTPQLTEDASGNVTQSDAMAAQTPVQSLGQAIPMLGPQMQPIALQMMSGAQQREDQQDFQRKQLELQQGTRTDERIFREREADKNRQLQKELVQLRADVGGDRPFYQFLQTPEGYVAGNARSGTVSPVMRDGRPVMPSQSSPQLQGAISEAKAGGKERGESQAQAQIDLPRVIDNANNSLQLIDQMIGSEDGTKRPHAGFESAVGLRVPGLGMIPGTDTSNFNTLLDQVKGGAFLEAFNSLKGGGQITEVEGKKATDAITRMQNAQSEREFIKAAREYQGVIRKGVQRAQTKASGGYTGPERRGVPTGVDPSLWAVMTPEERALWSQ